MNKPAWFDLMTSDAEGARKFYGDLLGWTFDVGGPESGFYAMCKKDGRDAAGIGQMQGNEGHPPSWTVYFNVESIDDAIAAITSAGGQSMMGPMQVFDAGRMAICADNTGAVFGLWQPERHRGARIVDEPGGMAWSEVNTRDAKKAHDFYTRVFGLQSQLIDAGGSDYYMLSQGETPACGILQMTAEWGDIPPHWMGYFAVDNADQAAEKVKASGGTVMQGPFDTPYGRMIVIKDPQGAHVSLIQAPPEGAAS